MKISLLLAVSGYLLAALLAFLGLRDGNVTVLLCAGLWLAIAIRHTKQYKLKKYIQDLKEDNNG